MFVYVSLRITSRIDRLVEIVCAVAALGSDVPYKVTYEGEWIRVIELFTPRRNPDPVSPDYYRAVIVWELGRTIDI